MAVDDEYVASTEDPEQSPETKEQTDPATEAPDAKEPEPIPLEPFEATFHYRSGYSSTHVLTSLQVDQYPGHGILGGKWSQDTAEPGDDLLQHVNWPEVLEITSRSLDGRPAKRVRRK